MLSHVPGLQTYNSKQPFSQVNGIAVQIYRQASKLTTSPGSLRRHIKITCDYITLQIYMRPAKCRGWKSARLAPRAIRMALHISISDDKFPAGGKTYIENYPAIDEVRSGIELAVR